MRDLDFKMPFAALKIKIMPVSPDTDLQEIENKAKTAIEELGARLHSSETEPIAFGLNALILTIAWPEDKELDLIESVLAKIENVNSVETVDFRRAIG